MLRGEKILEIFIKHILIRQASGQLMRWQWGPDIADSAKRLPLSLSLSHSISPYPSRALSHFHHRWSSLVHLSGFHLIIVSLFKSKKYFTHLLSLVLKVIVWSRSCQYKINRPFPSSPSLVLVSPSSLETSLTVLWLQSYAAVIISSSRPSVSLTPSWQKLAEKQSGRQRCRKRDEVRETG